jgi:multimeric flavodoxin WrbA
MKITCISASNVEPAREHSASTRACELIRDLAQAEGDAQVTIVPLIDYEMKPCRMCGKCVEAGKCVHDRAFNQVYQRLAEADAVFVVCPHYAPFPSKMMILLEKLQEICYLNWCQDQGYRTIVHQKPVGLVAHGGQTAEAIPYYKKALLDPLALSFASVQMKVVGAGEQEPNGVAFGIKDLSLTPGSLFVSIEHDWDDIRGMLAPLVKHVLAEVGE